MRNSDNVSMKLYEPYCQQTPEAVEFIVSNQLVFDLNIFLFLSMSATAGRLINTYNHSKFRAIII